jgi:polyprenyl P-hydroxybenzoate/phenylacrylic acid decarboxylase-like protein
VTAIVVALAGASGSVYPRRLLALLGGLRLGTLPGVPARPDLDVHWVATTNAALVWESELGTPLPEAFPGTRRWASHDFSAPFASGSSAPDAVIVAPCSMSTLARVAQGGGDDLIARACEVALKERRRLVLLARETPLSLVHLRNMVAATEAGAVVLPAVPSFYAGITTLDDAVDTVVARALDHVGIRLPLLRRWGDEP